MTKTPYWILGSLFIVSFLLGSFKVYESIPAQFVGLTIVLGLLTFMLFYLRSKSFKGFFDGMSISEMILCHCVRVPIGGAFIFYAAEGMLPEQFAKNAGYGDILTGCLGFVCAILVAKFPSSWRVTFGLWSVIGITDLCLAVGTGLYMATTIPGSMDWLTRLPLTLVPVVILPFLFGTHFIIVSRIWKNQITGDEAQ